jgi:photosystem II stability/assembly factor-like uncharacterized protein
MIILFSAPSAAEAHNRPVSLRALLVHPTDPKLLLAAGTWGLALSSDGGTSWRWLCAAMYGADPRREDPPLAITGEGTLLAATFQGLRRSSGTFACDWSDAPSPIDRGYIIDVTSSDRIAWAISTQGAEDDTLHRSDDEGLTFRSVYREHELLLERVRVAPNDPRFVYLSGGRPRIGDAPPETVALSSDDGGATFTKTQLELEAGETLLLITAVSPADPRRVFGEVINFNGVTAPERIIVSSDAGRTWRTVLRPADARSIAISSSGERVFIGSTLEGLWRSDDFGERFDHVAPNVHVRCLTLQAETLWICGEPKLDGFALARSDDGGRTITPVLRLSQIQGIASCPSCSRAAWTCPAWTADVVYDLALDAALPPDFDPDAGTGAPRDAGGPPIECTAGDAGPLPDAVVSPEPEASCGCRTRGTAGDGRSILGLAIALVFARRLSGGSGGLRRRSSAPRRDRRRSLPRARSEPGLFSERLPQRPPDRSGA